MRKTRLALLVAASLIVPVLAVPGAQAQILVEILALSDSPLDLGLGTVRLDGMGGFRTAVKDQNLKIALWDYVQNPAGFGDNRDSWSFDVRFTNNQLEEKDPVTPRTDLSSNDATLVFGYYKPKSFGVGGGIEYLEATHSQFFQGNDEFRISGWRVMANNYFLRTLSLGINFSLRDEAEQVFRDSDYNIDHDGLTLRLGGGAAWEFLRGVTVGGRAEYVKTERDGESRGPFHLDTFKWEIPGWLWSVHGFINRARLQGAVDYTREDLDGREDATISWSERFQLNPTNEPFNLQTATFSETRRDETLKTRWNLDIVPRVLNASIAYENRNMEQEVVTNQNALGSRKETDFSVNQWGTLVGASWVLFRQRLLVALELGKGQTDLKDRTTGVELTDRVKEQLAKVGVEYLLKESLVGRLGFRQVRRDLEPAEEEGKQTGLDTSVVTVGVGLVPAGGIWQFDMAFEVNVNSALDTERSKFQAYLRYLF